MILLLDKPYGGACVFGGGNGRTSKQLKRTLVRARCTSTLHTVPSRDISWITVPLPRPVRLRVLHFAAPAHIVIVLKRLQQKHCPW